MKPNTQSTKPPVSPAPASAHQSPTLVKEIAELILGLNEAITQVQGKQTFLGIQKSSNDQLIAEKRQGIVANLLPDLEIGTLENLERRCGKFVTTNVRSVFSRAADVRIPFLKRLSGNATSHRKEVMSTDLNALHTSLSAYICMRGNTEGQEFVEINALAKANEMLDTKLTALGRQEESLQEQLDSLSALQKRLPKNRPVQLPAEMTSAISAKAAALRSAKSSNGQGKTSPARPGNYPKNTAPRSSGSGFRSSGFGSSVPSTHYDDYYDDGLDFLILWATDIPTSLRTLAISEFLEQEPALSSENAMSAEWNGDAEAEPPADQYQQENGESNDQSGDADTGNDGNNDQGSNDSGNDSGISGNDAAYGSFS